MRPQLPSVAATLAVLAFGCRLFSSDLSKISSDPGRFHGQDVTVEGRVEASRWIAGAGVMGFRLVAGADSLLILTQGPLPAAGARVRLEGRVHRSFPVEGRDRVVLFATAPAPGGPGDTR